MEENNNTPTPEMPKLRLIPFDRHQRATVQRAHQQYASQIATVAACMGLGEAELAPDLSGFIVEDK